MGPSESLSYFSLPSLIPSRYMRQFAWHDSTLLPVYTVLANERPATFGIGVLVLTRGTIYTVAPLVRKCENLEMRIRLCDFL